MAYGRQSLRKAGQFLYGLEEDYANAVRRMIVGDDPHNIGRAILGGLAGNPIGSSYKTIKADANWEKALGIGAVAAADLSNFGIRYAAPMAVGSAVATGVGNIYNAMTAPPYPQANPGELPLS